MHPSLAQQGREFLFRHARQLDDHVGRLAPHEFDEGPRVRGEQKFLALVGQVQEQAIGPHHRENALGGAPGGAPEMVDLAGAVQRHGDLADIVGGGHGGLVSAAALLYHFALRETMWGAMRIVGFVTGLLCVLSSAQAADLSQIGPAAPAKSLLDARPAIQEPGFEFVCKPDGAAGTITVDIAKDFTAVSPDAMHETVYDYALRRILTLDDTVHSFHNTSLYAIVDFFAAETFNRRMLRGMLKGVKMQQATADMDPFWVQSELHVMDAEDGTPKIDRRAGKDGSVHFSHGGKEVASYTPSKQALTAEQGAGLTKFLRMATTLHPAIIDEIAASGFLPQHLSFALPPQQKKPAVAWTLQSFAVVKAAYPLRAGAKPELLTPQEAKTQPIAELLPVMQAAIAGTAPGKKSIADYHAQIDAAMNKSALFPAAVLGFEFNLQYGTAATACDAPCHGLKEVFTAAKDDPRTKAMAAALQPKSKAEGDAAIKTLTELKRDDLSDPYVIDDFLANDLEQAGQSDKALPLFAAAIRANPYMGGYYKDLGDVYREGFEPDLAWLCYDLGRALPAAADVPVIGYINAHEADLLTKYPQFF